MRFSDSLSKVNYKCLFQWILILIWVNQKSISSQSKEFIPSSPQSVGTASKDQPPSGSRLNCCQSTSTRYSWTSALEGVAPTTTAPSTKSAAVSGTQSDWTCSTTSLAKRKRKQYPGTSTSSIKPKCNCNKNPNKASPNLKKLLSLKSNNRFKLSIRKWSRIRKSKLNRNYINLFLA